MRSILLLFLISALAVFMACTSSAAPTSIPPIQESAQLPPEVTGDDQAGHEHDDEAPRINLADAKKAFDAGEVIFLDTRAEAAYNAEHIKGAINIPMSILSTRYNEIAKGKKIIAYCS